MLCYLETFLVFNVPFEYRIKMSREIERINLLYGLVGRIICIFNNFV